MPTRLFIIVMCIATAVAAGLPRASASAKGDCCFFNAFRISGGTLPRAVTIPIEDVLASTSGLGSWYADDPRALSPEPAGVIYRVEVLGVNIAQEQVVFDERYRTEPEPMMTTENGTLWARPAPEIEELLDRYIVADEAGVLPEKPSFEEALRATADYFDADVVVGDDELAGDARSRVLSDIENIAAVSFGVQANLVGQRDLSVTTVEVKFERGALSLSYVPPGIIAPFGLLMVPRTTHSWALTTWIDPPGYSQIAFTVPDDFDALMKARGATARTTYDVKQVRAIPLLHAKQYKAAYDRAEVSREGRTLGAISPDAFAKLCDPCDPLQPVEPFLGDPVTIEIWPKGYDPFPEAVKPIEYAYYRSDSSGRGLGVLVTTATGGAGNASFGGFDSPIFASADIDRDVASLVAADEGRSRGGRSRAVAAAVAAGLAMVFVGALIVSRRVASSPAVVPPPNNLILPHPSRTLPL